MNWLQKVAKERQPWEFTKDEFMQHHFTGHIPYSAYSGSKTYTLEKMQEIIGSKENYPKLITTIDINGINVEFRQSGKKDQYVQHDKGNIVRDEHGMATYMSDEEVLSKDLPLWSPTISFYIDETPIGWVGESFGATELFVAKEVQRRGIGSVALKLWLEMYPTRHHSPRQLGQMTPAGQSTLNRSHRMFVEDAIGRSENVPANVLKEYPDLTS